MVTVPAATSTDREQGWWLCNSHMYYAQFSSESMWRHPYPEWTHSRHVCVEEKVRGFSWCATAAEDTSHGIVTQRRGFILMRPLTEKKTYRLSLYGGRFCPHLAGMNHHTSSLFLAGLEMCLLLKADGPDFLTDRQEYKKAWGGVITVLKVITVTQTDW